MQPEVAEFRRKVERSERERSSVRSTSIYVRYRLSEGGKMDEVSEAGQGILPIIGRIFYSM